MNNFSQLDFLILHLNVSFSSIVLLVLVNKLVECILRAFLGVTLRGLIQHRKNLTFIQVIYHKLNKEILTSKKIGVEIQYSLDVYK